MKRKSDLALLLGKAENVAVICRNRHQFAVFCKSLSISPDTTTRFSCIHDTAGFQGGAFDGIIECPGWFRGDSNRRQDMRNLISRHVRMFPETLRAEWGPDDEEQ